MIELLQKKDDGEYDFSDSGIFHAYFLTMEKLVVHYMQKGMKLPSNILDKKRQGLKKFILDNFLILDDFLDKLPNLAEFLGEANLARFSGFIGKNFILSLEKTKNALYEKELPRSKDRNENPYRTTSSDFMDLYENDFLKSKLLTWPLEEALKNQEIIVDSNEGLVSLVPLATTPVGERILKKYGKLFEDSPEIQWPLNEKVEKREIVDDTTPTISPVSQQLPSEIMLEKFEKEFIACPFLDVEVLNGSIQGSTNSLTSNVQKKSSLPVQLTIRELARLLNIIKKFTLAKDNAGYQKWLASLKDIHKASVVVNRLVNNHLKTGQVDWSNEINKLATKLGLTLQVIEKIKIDILGYKKVLPTIQQYLQQLKKDGLDATTASSLYSQLINLFENNGSYDSKKTALKMTLLQITDPSIKKNANELFGNLLDKAKDIYQLT